MLKLFREKERKREKQREKGDDPILVHRYVSVVCELVVEVMVVLVWLVVVPVVLEGKERREERK